MAKKRVNISIDEELDKRWTKVANQLGWKKSAMVEDFLREALPYLEDITPKNIIPRAVKTLGDKVREIGDLLEDSVDK